MPWRAARSRARPWPRRRCATRLLPPRGEPFRTVARCLRSEAINELHRRRLRAFFTGGFFEANFRTDLETVEIAVQHGVSVEVNLAPVERLEKSVVVEEPHHESSRLGMRFHVAAAQ